jgi:SAM-dependent methyltransferase
MASARSMSKTNDATLEQILGAHGGGQLLEIDAAGQGPRILRATSTRPESPLDLSSLGAGLAPGTPLLVQVPSQPSSQDLTAWRNALWPEFHVGALWTSVAGQLTQTTLQGVQANKGSGQVAGVILVAAPRHEVLAPKATMEKFDANAAGWNGFPGTPSYRHFRWMRCTVADRAGKGSFKRILDFGSGAGWVGIEAALKNPGASLAAFDPSPEMVRIAGENARAQNISGFTGRVGFGEAPPFPGAGEAQFDLVLSSGVISFSSDPEAWLDGLVATMAPGATLVIGDAHRGSLGFKRRRRKKPLLPVRELSAWRREDVRRALERRGLSFECWGGYQLTRPVPELMHLNETRLTGLLTWPLLLLNQSAAALNRSLGLPGQDCFDSWVMRLSRPLA